jgi:GTP cyclohydrolase I
MAQDAAQHARRMLESLGLDPDDDPELAETPERFTKFLETFFDGTDGNPPEMSTFPTDHTGAGEASEPVVLTALPFYSMCVHHLVPFFGTFDVAYVPGETMTGFGSVGRVIDHFAGRPQVQERLVEQVTEFMWDELSPRGLLVRSTARQMCMEMRGAEKTGRTVATASRGNLTDGELRRDVTETFRTTRDDR